MTEKRLEFTGATNISESAMRSLIGVEKGAVSLATVRADSVVLTSEPPTGAYRITNAFLVDVGGKKVLRVFFKDDPEP